jgi:heme/copper-type cytochrome/quinol oxidase subunit 2
VIGGADANTATGAGLTVIVLVCVIVLAHASVNVHVSVTDPPQGPGNALKVDVTVPLIKHVPLALFV